MRIKDIKRTFSNSEKAGGILAGLGLEFDGQSASSDSPDARVEILVSSQTQRTKRRRLRRRNFSPWSLKHVPREEEECVYRFGDSRQALRKVHALTGSKDRHEYQINKCARRFSLTFQLASAFTYFTSGHDHRPPSALIKPNSWGRVWFPSALIYLNSSPAGSPEAVTAFFNVAQASRALSFFGSPPKKLKDWGRKEVDIAGSF